MGEEKNIDTIEKECIEKINNLKNTFCNSVEGDYKNEFFKIISFEKRIEQFIEEVKTQIETNELVVKTPTPEEAFEKSFEEFCEGLYSFICDYPNIARFFMYKIYCKGARFDCDVTKEGLEKLSKFLPRDNEKPVVVKQGSGGHKHQIEVTQNNEPCIYRGDTMNSFWGLFRNFLKYGITKIICNKACVPKYIDKLEYGLFGEGSNKEEDVANPKSWFHFLCLNYASIREDKDQKREGNITKLCKFDEFARLNHTIGNFIVVPYVEGLSNNNYNTKRFSVFRDCFDLSLNDIKKYYDKKSQKSDCEKNDTKIDYKKAGINFWLDEFDSFDEFIKVNHLQDYVDTIDDNMHVIDLSKSKDDKIETIKPDKLRKSYIPNTQAEIETYLDNVIDRIEKRNKRIK